MVNPATTDLGDLQAIAPQIKPEIDRRIAPAPPYAGLIFDCDGTLADTLPVHFSSWQTALNEQGATLAETWYQGCTGLTALEFIQTFNQTFGHNIDFHQIDAVRQRQFMALIARVRAVESVAAIAQSNFGKVPMAVASNGQRSVVESTLETIGLRPLFKAIVTLNDVAVGKPAPDLFLLAAKRLGVLPADCIVYEDSDLGLEAARRAGMRSIDVRVLQTI